MCSRGRVCVRARFRMHVPVCPCARVPMSWCVHTRAPCPCMCAYVHVCVCVRACIRTYVHDCIPACAPACTYQCAYMCECALECASTCMHVHVCAHACVRAYVRAYTRLHTQPGSVMSFTSIFFVQARETLQRNAVEAMETSTSECFFSSHCTVLCTLVPLLFSPLL